ncbi:MAG: phosphatidylglycerol lysyltransferase domain-containing protein [Eubacterium sp.]|nr:phosphatidylglycerol lysyltransferase domain-containing protein [Eubacterium sp.]
MSINTDTALPLTFLPLSLSQKEKIESIRIASGNNQYVYTFASLFVWKTDEKYEVCLSDDAFIIKNGIEGDNDYLFPCGSNTGKKALIDALIKNGIPVFHSVTDEDKLFLEAEYPDLFVFEECRDDFVYLYDKKEQIELRGTAYKRLRHKINRGRDSAAEWLIEPITADNVERAMKINKRWAESLGNEGPADIIPAETALNYFSELSMWGLLFSADGQDVAYVTGAFITPEIFDLSFCKVLDKRCGFFVKWAMYRELPQSVITVDSEEDLGIEGLRSHKLQRQPKELRRIWKGSLIK